MTRVLYREGPPQVPRVSILMPFRNAAQTIAETLDSIHRQTFGDYELIAVDDGSSDASAQIVARHAAADPRIRLHRSPGQGLVPALNYGLRLAVSELIARMDADDLMHRDRLREQIEMLEESVVRLEASLGFVQATQAIIHSQLRKNLVCLVKVFLGFLSSIHRNIKISC